MPIITTTKPMRPRDNSDHYPTHYDVCAAALRMLPQDRQYARILDPGAGTGVWGQAARLLWPKAVIIGIELRNVEPDLHYDQWIHRSYRGATVEPVDLVMGNPPYKNKLPEYFIGRSLDLLKARRGVLVYLLPLTFLAGQTRGKTLYRHSPPSIVYVMSRRPSFIHSGEKAGKTDATEYAIYVWDFLMPVTEPIIRWFDWQATDTQTVLF